MESILYLTENQGSIDIAKTSVNSDTCHYRLAHISDKGMKNLYIKAKILGLKVLDFEFFNDCVLEKLKRLAFVK